MHHFFVLHLQQMITPASIQEIMNRVDIVDVIGQFVRLKKRGANYIGNCPFHNEKTPSFNVSAAKGIFKCFGCGKAGDTLTFVQEHEKLTYPEALRWLADYYKITLEETERTPEQQQQQMAGEALRILNEFAAGYFHDNLLNNEEGQLIGLSYFKQRGFRKDIIERFSWGIIQTAEMRFTEMLSLKGIVRKYWNGRGLQRIVMAATTMCIVGVLFFPYMA
jgi:DNA primase